MYLIYLRPFVVLVSGRDGVGRGRERYRPGPDLSPAICLVKLRETSKTCQDGLEPAYLPIAYPSRKIVTTSWHY